MRLNQHFAVLSQHIFAIVFHPVGIIVSRLGTGNVGVISLLISIIVALPYVIVAFAVLNAYIQFTVFITHSILTLALVCTIHISDITAAEDVAVPQSQLFSSTHRTAKDMYLGLSEDVTVGIERTAFS